ncbi:hypothetical protein [Nostoc sp.]|uniref:hypothetical protein n=1 Tax=Nostoc sp. TaxID=1180 RepID=UPI002FF09D27
MFIAVYRERRKPETQQAKFTAIAHTELRSLLHWINLTSLLLLKLRLHIFMQLLQE